MPRPPRQTSLGFDGSLYRDCRPQLLGLRVTKKEVEAMLDEVDRDGSGKQGGRACRCLCVRSTHVPAGAIGGAAHCWEAGRSTCPAAALHPASKHHACVLTSASHADPSHPPCTPGRAGEVEYAEFLEIMTVQLNRMAEDRDSSSSAASRVGSSGTEGGEAGGEGGGGGVGTPDAAALPFDVVATAYRRKKLLEALDQDNK